MKKRLVILIFCLTIFLNPLTGQIIDNKTTNDFDTTLLETECKLDKEELGKIFTKTELPAHFRGGIKKWFEYAEKNFDFDYVLQNLTDSVLTFQDSIIVKFIVARNGTICNIKVLGGNSILNIPTIKLLKLSPNWIPASSGGRLINSYRTLKLDILINKIENINTIMLYHNSYHRGNDK